MKERFVETDDGIRLHVAERGEGGLPLLLLHGRTSNGTTFAPCLDALARRRKVIALDLRGHGRSDAPRERSAYSMERWLADLLQVVDALKLARYALLGHSMGGFVALRHALACPPGLAGLIMEDSGPGRNPLEDPPSRSWGDEEIRLAEEEGMEAVVRRFGGDSLPPCKRRRLLDHAPWSYAHAIRVCRATEGVAHRLDEIRVPALILCGERDASFLEASRLMAARMPSARMVLLENAGHSPHREATEAFVDALESFLDALPRNG